MERTAGLRPLRGQLWRPRLGCARRLEPRARRRDRRVREEAWRRLSRLSAHGARGEPGLVLERGAAALRDGQGRRDRADELRLLQVRRARQRLADAEDRGPDRLRQPGVRPSLREGRPFHRSFRLGREGVGPGGQPAGLCRRRGHRHDARDRRLEAGRLGRPARHVDAGRRDESASAGRCGRSGPARLRLQGGRLHADAHVRSRGRPRQGALPAPLLRQLARRDFGSRRGDRERSRREGPHAPRAADGRP